METIPDLDAAFEEAVKSARDLGNLDQETMLRLYGLYKQATIGACNISKPGMLSFTARYKWDAWNSLGSLSSTDAKTRYIELVNSLETENAGDATRKAKPSALGVSVSCMAKTEEELEDGDKTIFDWLKEDNSQQVSSLLQKNPLLLNQPDEQGMTLLHWSADRGSATMIQLLAEKGADMNALDKSGQTALHYAYACGHDVCIRLLEEHGTDPTIRDDDGLLPNELSDS